MNTRRDIFNNRNVRLALSYAYDHEWINKQYIKMHMWEQIVIFDNSPLASSGLPSKNELELLNVWKDEIPAEVFTETFIPPITDGSGNDRKNLLKAKDILEKEGWFVENGKLMKDGTEFKFEFLIVSPSDEKIALAYQSNLKKLRHYNGRKNCWFITVSRTFVKLWFWYD